MASKTDAKRAQSLLEDHQVWYDKARGTHKIGETRFAGCDEVAFLSWDCCEVHRALEYTCQELMKRGEALNVSSEGGVFSAAWWGDLGRETGIAIPDKFPYQIQLQPRTPSA